LRTNYVPAVTGLCSEDDQIVPFADSGPLAAKLLKNGTLKVYQGLPHGMPTTHADQINVRYLLLLVPTPSMQLKSNVRKIAYVISGVGESGGDVATFAFKSRTNFFANIVRTLSTNVRDFSAMTLHLKTGKSLKAKGRQSGN
jgi:hypothetical protein